MELELGQPAFAEKRSLGRRGVDLQVVDAPWRREHPPSHVGTILAPSIAAGAQLIGCSIAPDCPNSSAPTSRNSDTPAGHITLR